MILALIASLVISKPIVHTRIDWGIPDSFALALQLEDTTFIELGLVYDLGGLGFKMGWGVYTPSFKGFRIDLRGDVGFVSKGDVTHVAKLVTGNDALDFALLKDVDYSFETLSAGLVFTYGHFEIYGRVGWGWLQSVPTDLGSDLRELLGIDISSKNAAFGYSGLALRTGVGFVW